MEKLSAWHGDPAIKAKYVARLKQHIEADELVRGIGFVNGRGCAIGCTLDRYEHEAYPEELGMPVWVAKLNDALHEETSVDVWPTLQLRFLKSVKPGTDFVPIYHQLLGWLQRRNAERVKSLDISDELKATVVEAIERCAELHELMCDVEGQWSAAWSAAWSAESAARSAESAAWSAAWSAAESAWSAAWSAAESAARSAVWSARSAVRSAESAESAVWSAVWSARSAARSAVWSAAESARSAESAEFDAIAEKLIELCEAA